LSQKTTILGNPSVLYSQFTPTSRRHCLSAMGRQHAYFDVGNTTKPKQLFSSVLSQLHGLKRKHDRAYAGVLCDSSTDFMVEVASACVRTVRASVVIKAIAIDAPTYTHTQWCVHTHIYTNCDTTRWYGHTHTHTHTHTHAQKHAPPIKRTPPSLCWTACSCWQKERCCRRSCAQPRTQVGMLGLCQ